MVIVVTMSANLETGLIPWPKLNQRLRLAREETALDTKVFAEEIGVSRQTVLAYERGAYKPRPVVLKMWAMRTGVDLHWLETGEAPSPGGGEGAGVAESRLSESNRRPIHYRSGHSRRAHLTAA